MEANILIASDLHESSDSQPNQKRWFPGHISRWSPDRQLAYLHSWDELTSRSLGHLITKAKQLGPFSRALFLGDLTSGDNEEGLLTQEAQKQCRDILTHLNVNLFGVERNFVLGGHDCGYRRQRDFKAVLYGLKKAEEILGPSWQSIKIGKHTIICLNSEIPKAAARFSDSIFKDMSARQAEFLARELREANGNVILAIHNPLALKCLESILKLHSEKIVLALAGHMHLKLFNTLFYFVPLFRYINLHIVPSPWGLGTPWGAIGQGGFCVLTLNDDGFILKYHRL